MIRAKIKIYCICCGKNQPIGIIPSHTGKHAIKCKRGHVIGEYTEYTFKKVGTKNGIYKNNLIDL